MSNTLRLLMPQWQGGDNPAYSFGAKLLAWLAPVDEKAPPIEVPVKPCNGTKLSEEGGVVARSVLLEQLHAASKIIESNQPERIIVFGGDCLVSQAPFSYLNEKYKGTLGVLWLDAHPDISTPDMFNHEHAMVLGNLLGEGDSCFAAEVKTPLNPKCVMYGGLQKMTPQETEIVDRLSLRRVGSLELEDNSNPILDWIKENDIKHLAIHLDLDVLDPSLFRSLLFSEPQGIPIDAPSGKMTLPQVARLIQDASQITDIVGLSITEHLAWDAMNIHVFLNSLPIFYK